MCQVRAILQVRRYRWGIRRSLQWIEIAQAAETSKVVVAGYEHSVSGERQRGEMGVGRQIAGCPGG